MLIYLFRTRKDEEDDGHDDDGIRDEDGGYGADCNCWSVSASGKSSDYI